MRPAGFKPAIAASKTHALERAATSAGCLWNESVSTARILRNYKYAHGQKAGSDRLWRWCKLYSNHSASVAYDTNAIYVSLPRIPVHHFHVLESSVRWGYEGHTATIGRAQKHRVAQFSLNVSGRKYCLNIELVSVLGICSAFNRCFICSEIGHHGNCRSNRYKWKFLSVSYMREPNRFRTFRTINVPKYLWR